MAMLSVCLRIGLGVTFFGAVAAVAVAQDPATSGAGAVKRAYDDPVKVADGVWFERHHDVPTVGSNVAWIEFADFVAVVDTAFPLGAERALKSIKRTVRGKPIRYAIVTHHHDDHSFGSGAFAREGAIIVAHENARQRLIDKGLASYAKKAARDEVFARNPLSPPQLAFKDHLVIDDGKGRRAELYWFGAAHTNGDIFTYLPREKIVFTGDACVNGDHNYMGDGDTKSWIDVLTRVQALGPEIVVPGHGALGQADLLDTQKHYFVELRRQVGALIQQGKSADEARALVDIPRWKQWTGKSEMKAPAIAHVYGELTRATATAAPVGAAPPPAGPKLNP